MPGIQSPATRVRFREFTLDLEACEFRKDGTVTALGEQPRRLLEVLVERPGVVVSREDLRERLWGAETFVDFEHGLNAAVKRLRDALGDSAEHPRYIETVPKRGYRFIAPVERIATSAIDIYPTVKHRPVSWLLLVGIAAVIVAASLTFSLLSARASVGVNAAPYRLTRITFDTGQQTDPTFSPDGKYIAYASNKTGNFDIWMQPLEGGPATQLTDDPANDTQPNWSPDGRSIAFRSERYGGGLFLVFVADKHVQRLTRIGYRPQWSPDGSYLALGGGLFFDGTIYVARSDGTDVNPVQMDPLGVAEYATGWDRGGRLVSLAGGFEHVSVMAMAPPAWNRTFMPITPAVLQRFRNLSLGVVGRQRLAWSHDGRAMYFVGEANASKDIWRLSVDPESLRVTDGPVRVTTGLESDLTPASDRAGRMLAFSTATASNRVWLLDLDATGRLDGRARPVTPLELDATQPGLSRDGRRLTIIVLRPGGRPIRELREIALDNGREKILRTYDESNSLGDWAMTPRPSPDGSQLLYSYREVTATGARSGIRRLDLDSLVETPLVSSADLEDGSYGDNPWSWSADSRSVVATGTRYRQGFFNLVRLPLTDAPAAEKSVRILASSDQLRFWQADESPDGRWVCFNATTRESDNSGIYVVPASGGAPRRLSESNTWDDKPRWSRDGRWIYFISTRGGGDLNIWAMGFDPALGTSIGAPIQLTHYSGTQGTIGEGIRTGPSDISIGGSRIAVPIQSVTGAIWIIE